MMSTQIICTIYEGDIVERVPVPYEKLRQAFKEDKYKLPIAPPFMLGEFQVARIWHKVNLRHVVRPWSHWAIPATRCQRVRGVK